jgi:eukaryotic-like serine/threonine-protein kinase
MAIRSFDHNFLNHFGINNFFQKEKKGGQKSVHFIERGGVKQVMKLFDGGKDVRFDREMEIYSKYSDLDGIPKIYEMCEYEGETLIFEQFIEGHTLSDIITTYQGNNDSIGNLLKRIFEILKPIWNGRYVHRDIKPENIIIKPDKTPVVIDFGIARDLDSASITGTGAQPGTWKWAAPEQYAGIKDMISYRTDFFSLGLIAYFLYHQKLPFGNTVMEIDAKFKSGDENFAVDIDCKLTNFLIESLKFKASHRPKDYDDLIKLI